MDYSNPEIPEGINTSKEHPLKEFFILLGGILAVIVVAVVIISFMAEKLAAHIPYSFEKELLSGSELFIDDENPEVVTYLKNLSDKLAAYMELPDDMEITVHYMDDEIENAFATLGGHIYIYRGLMNLLPMKWRTSNTGILSLPWAAVWSLDYSWQALPDSVAIILSARL